MLGRVRCGQGEHLRPLFGGGASLSIFAPGARFTNSRTLPIEPKYWAVLIDFFQCQPPISHSFKGAGISTAEENCVHVSALFCLVRACSSRRLWIGSVIATEYSGKTHQNYRKCASEEVSLPLQLLNFLP